VFLLVLYFSSALLFFPGAQAVRGAIRAMPYVTSLLFLVAPLGGGGLTRCDRPGRWCLLFSLGFMGLGLLHPEANVCAGVAQIVFQVSIVGPYFWCARHQVSPARLRRLMGLVFLCNAASAVTGLLQFWDPDRFMPPEFSAAVISSDILSQLAYSDAAGRTVVRPPGLTDLPGGAAGGAAVTAVFGLLLAGNPAVRPGRRLACAALAAVGLVALYLTLNRSLLMVTVLVTGLACVQLLRQGRVRQGVVLGAASAAAVVGGFLAAAAIGGDAVYERYFGILETGIAVSYQTNRGGFLEYTVRYGLTEYPLGAGAGRWGMMLVYFGHFDGNPSPPLWAELQITGWLYDGGIPLILTYLGAVGAVLLGLYRLASSAGPLAYPALMAFCAALFIAVQSFAGPSFNSTGGMQFWLLAALVFRAAGGRYPRAGEVP
jgi:hypothetical protein